MDLKKIFGAFGAAVLLLATLASVFAAVPYVKTVEDFQFDIEDLTIEQIQLKADFEEAKADFNKKGDTTDLKKSIGFLKSLYTSVENLEAQIKEVGGNKSHYVQTAMPSLLAQTKALKDKIQALIGEGESLVGVVHNTAPVLANPGNKEVEEGKVLEFTLAAVDADGDVLGYSAENLPTGAAFDGAAKKFSWTPAAGQAGTYTVTFKATDSKETTLETITITVKVAGSVPPVDNGTGETAPASTAETDEDKYDVLKNKFEDFEDDFDDLADDWKKADTDKKKENVEDDFDNLDEDLKDLKKDASSLKSEVTDDDVKDDLDDLKDDIAKLREEITNLINGVEKDTSSTVDKEETVVKETKKTAYTVSEEEEPEVVFNQLPASIVPSTVLEPVEPKNDMNIIYVLGGVAAAIFLLILVFIIVALVK
ncbi:MAG TPA: Ig domain-containing protein [Candidatus Nanoarchaeia archaeon]|nr:Ig domain-containing protein [Candidatus Nanoarchaeia archaeon]